MTILLRQPKLWLLGAWLLAVLFLAVDCWGVGENGVF